VAAYPDKLETVALLKSIVVPAANVIASEKVGEACVAYDDKELVKAYDDKLLAKAYDDKLLVKAYDDRLLVVAYPDKLETVALVKSIVVLVANVIASEKVGEAFVAYDDKLLVKAYDDKLLAKA